jgi:asparagine synthase (glutamine-hydrolysing)
VTTKRVVDEPVFGHLPEVLAEFNVVVLLTIIRIRSSPMCGICGIWLHKPDVVPVDLLTDMNEQIVHRGPDEAGAHLDAGIGLAIRRLSIIDLLSGQQPLSNEDGSYWIVFNGEIYNYQALRAQLCQRGHHFTTQSDTEVLVHGYEEWGVDLLTRLNGMFAFALWDSKQDELIIARDRVGKKPLYYTNTAERFLFASEIKSLLVAPDVNPAVDADALSLYLTFGYVPADHTLFAGVWKLPAGSYLRLARGQSQPTSKRYWDLSSQTLFVNGHNESPEERLRELLQDAVQKRMIADVPVGVLLSGGLDSSAVVAWMKQAGISALKSFSVSFREQAYDEAPFAQIVATHLGTEHYELHANNCTPELLRKIVWHSDEPVADPALVPTYLVSKLAREHVKVVLTGEGADELFAGYFYHPRAIATQWVDQLPTWFSRQWIAQAALASNRLLARERYHPRTRWGWTLPPNARVLAWTAIFTEDERQEYLADSRLTTTGQPDSVTHMLNVAGDRPFKDWLDRLLYLDIKIPLVDDLLMKVDKMSMAASLEARCPFLDYRLIEFATTLPAALKLHNNENKLILRRAMREMLPDQILTRAKHGFDVPIHRWLQEDLHELFWDSVRAQRFKDLDIITDDALHRLQRDLEAGVPGRARQLWTLLCLAVWLDIFSVRVIR